MHEQEIIQQLSTLTQPELIEGLKKTEDHLLILKNKLSTSTDILSVFSVISEEDKAKIKKVLLARSVPTPLYFISKELAQTLAGSTDLYLKEIGNKSFAYLMSSENKYVNKDSGVFTSCIRGSYSTPNISNGVQIGVHTYEYYFSAYWDIKKNAWGHFTPHQINCTGCIFTSPIDATILEHGLKSHIYASPVQCNLLCDAHIAAAIGDIETIKKHLEKHSEFARNNLNGWGKTPFDCAIETGQYDVIKFLLDNKAILKESHLLIAIEKGNFALIDLLLSHYNQVSDAMIKQAEKRNNLLAEYLSLYQYNAIGKVMKSLHEAEPLGKLKEILSDNNVNRQTVSNFLQLRPNVLALLDKDHPLADSKKDTILHWAAKHQNPFIFVVLVEGIYHCKFQGVDIYSFFDVQATNANSQTALNLLMANKDMQFNTAIKALLLYCNPMLPIALREKIVVERKMDIIAIEQERKALDQQQIVATATQSRENTRALIKTNQLISAQTQVIQELEHKLSKQEREISELKSLMTDMLVLWNNVPAQNLPANLISGLPPVNRVPGYLRFNAPPVQAMQPQAQQQQQPEQRDNNQLIL